MTASTISDQKLEKEIQKQMGCMTGFFQLFDRHQILTGKRIYATKRLSGSSPIADSTTQSEVSSVASPMYSKELLPEYQQVSQPRISSSEIKKPPPSPENRSPGPEISTPVRMPLPLPVFDTKESLRTPWKLREAPRLSLDSRASFDGKGKLYPREIRTNAAILSSNRCQSFAESSDSDENDKQRRSPSVIARLMGLEALPDSRREPIKKSELRRSSSESRVLKDFQYRFIDSEMLNSDNVVSEENRFKSQSPELMEYLVRKPKYDHQQKPHSSSPWNTNNNNSQFHQQNRKIFYDSQDFFPEPKHNGSIYAEIERRLKMRGIDEPEKDLDTLKQIFEALQLKGLLHSKKQVGNRNFVFDNRRFPLDDDESPIVIMKPSRSSQFLRRTEQEYSSSSPNSTFRSRTVIKRNLIDSLPPPVVGRSKPNRLEIERNNIQKEKKSRSLLRSSSDPNESSASRSPSSLAKRRSLNIETQRRGNDSIDQRRISPINSPRVSPRSRTGSSDQTPNQSPRTRKLMTDLSPRERISSHLDDDSSAISESSISTSSPIESELQGSKMGDYKEGRSLLERCGKLLHSIAEITSVETELQPSPVSVLDSSFYKDESSPSPIMRRRYIDFKESDHQSMDLEEDTSWSSPMISPIRMKFEDFSKLEDSDFVYISEILRVSDCLSGDTNVFLLLEKQKYNCSSKVSRVQRRLVFDTVTEILDRKRQLPPWKLFSSTGKPCFRQIWSEFKRIRERDLNEDLFEVICGALKKDMSGDTLSGWVESPIETSDTILDIERLIFKDLIAETISDLAVSAGKCLVPAPPRRTLVF